MTELPRTPRAGDTPSPQPDPLPAHKVRGQLYRWEVRHVLHTGAYHTSRLPKRGAKVAMCAPCPGRELGHLP
jgi:hypothetical protein